MNQPMERELPTADELVSTAAAERQPAPPTFKPVRLLPAFLPLRIVLVLLLPGLFIGPWLFLGQPPAAARPTLLWIALGLALISLPGAYLLERLNLLEKRFYRWGLPALDMGLIFLLHLGHCGARSPFFPLFYVPIAYAGLLAGYAGGLAAGLLAAALYGIAYALGPRPDEPTLALSIALLFVGAGAISGYLGRTFARLNARGQAILEQARQLHHEVEERRETYERWYRAVDRLKADFVYSASHELRTPLTPVKGYLQLLSNPGFSVSREKRQEYMRIMSNNVDTLAQLIDDIIYLQRVTRIPIDLGNVVLSEVARQAIEEVTSESEEAQVRVHMDDWAGLPTILGSADSLKLVLSSLLENAIRDSTPGSTVLLSLRPDGDGIEVRVAGTGRGIPIEQQERLFDLFFHADSSPTYVLGREGLSLAIARYIVEMHGGRICVENEPRGGMAFTIHLPGRK